jgi:hypothetical protein
VAGKRRASRNATSHGIYCRDLVLPGESNAEFRALRDSYLMRLNPQDVLELLIVDRIVAAAWKLRRLQSAEPFIHNAEAQVMRRGEQRQREQIEDDLIEHQRSMGGDPRDVEAMLEAAEAQPAHQRFPAAATLAVSLVRGDGGFERLTRIEQRLERSIHRNLDELRKLRKLNDEVASLRPSLRPCPFLADPAEEPVAEAAARQEVENSSEGATTGVQNEAKADEASKENAAGAIQIRAEYSPTPPSTAAPRVGNPCHDEAAEPQVHQKVEEPAVPAATSVQNEAIGDACSKGNAAGASQIRAEYGPTPLSTAAPRAGSPCHEEAPRAGSPCDETVNPFRYRYRAPPRGRGRYGAKRLRN